MAKVSGVTTSLRLRFSVGDIGGHAVPEIEDLEGLEVLCNQQVADFKGTWNDRLPLASAIPPHCHTSEVLD